MNINITFTPIIPAIIGYLLIISGILYRKETSNFATWFLWTILDIIVLVGLHRSGSDTTLVWAFTIGTGITTLCLLAKKQIAWTKTETYTVILTSLCIVISFVATPFIGVIAGSIAVFVAGLPYFDFLVRNKIKVYALTANLCFFVCSAISLLLVKNGPTTGIIFPATCTLYWLIGTYLSMKSYQR